MRKLKISLLLLTFLLGVSALTDVYIDNQAPGPTFNGDKTNPYKSLDQFNPSSTTTETVAINLYFARSDTPYEVTRMNVQCNQCNFTLQDWNPRDLPNSPILQTTFNDADLQFINLINVASIAVHNISFIGSSKTSQSSFFFAFQEDNSLILKNLTFTNIVLQDQTTSGSVGLFFTNNEIQDVSVEDLEVKLTPGTPVTTPFVSNTHVLSLATVSGKITMTTVTGMTNFGTGPGYYRSIIANTGGEPTIVFQNFHPTPYLTFQVASKFFTLDGYTIENIKEDFTGFPAGLDPKNRIEVSNGSSLSNIVLRNSTLGGSARMLFEVVKKENFLEPINVTNITITDAQLTCFTLLKTEMWLNVNLTNLDVYNLSLHNYQGCVPRIDISQENPFMSGQIELFQVYFDFELYIELELVPEILRSVNNVKVSNSLIVGGVFINKRYENWWNLKGVNLEEFIAVSHQFSTVYNSITLSNSSLSNHCFFSHNVFHVMLLNVSSRNNQYNAARTYCMAGYLSSFLSEGVSIINDTFLAGGGFYKDLDVFDFTEKGGLQANWKSLPINIKYQEILAYLIVLFEDLNISNSSLSDSSMIWINQRGNVIFNKTQITEINPLNNSQILKIAAMATIPIDERSVDIEAEYVDYDPYLHRVSQALNFTRQIQNATATNFYSMVLLVNMTIFDVNIASGQILSISESKELNSRIVLYGSQIGRIHLNSSETKVIYLYSCYHIIMQENLFTKTTGNGDYMSLVSIQKFTFKRNWVNFLYNVLTGAYDGYESLSLNNLAALRQFPASLESGQIRYNFSSVDLTFLQINFESISLLELVENNFTQINTGTNLIWVTADKIMEDILITQNQFQAISTAAGFITDYYSRSTLLFLDLLRVSKHPDAGENHIDFSKNTLKDIALFPGSHFTELLRNDLVILQAPLMSIEVINNYFENIRQHSNDSAIFDLVSKTTVAINSNTISKINLGAGYPMFEIITATLLFSNNQVSNIKANVSSIPNGLLDVKFVYKSDDPTAKTMDIKIENNTFVSMLGSFASVLYTEKAELYFYASNNTFLGCLSATNGAFFVFKNCHFEGFNLTSTFLNYNFTGPQSLPTNSTPTSRILTSSDEVIKLESELFLLSLNFLQIDTASQEPGTILNIEKFYTNNWIAVEGFKYNNITLHGLLFGFSSMNKTMANFSDIEIRDDLLYSAYDLQVRKPFVFLGTDSGSISVENSVFQHLQLSLSSLIRIPVNQNSKTSLVMSNTTFQNINFTLKSMMADFTDFHENSLNWRSKSMWFFNDFALYQPTETSFAVVHFPQGKLINSTVTLSISIDSTNFTDITYATNGGNSSLNTVAFLLEYRFNSTVNLTNLRFENVQTNLGGAVTSKYANNAVLSSSNITLSNCTFLNNTGASGAPCIMSGDSALSISNCTFKNNRNNFSFPAVMYTNILPSNGGGNVYENNINVALVNYSSYNVREITGENSTMPVSLKAVLKPTGYYQILEADGAALESIDPSTFETIPIHFEILDAFNQFVLDDSKVEIRFTMIDYPEASTSLYCPVSTDTIYANCSFNNLGFSLIGYENVFYTYKFEYISDRYGTLSFFQNVSMRKCAPGEVNQTTQNYTYAKDSSIQQSFTSCKKCAQNYYSLDPDNNTCIPCPSFATCPGGDVINIYKGFYYKNASDNRSFQIMPCPDPERCKGGAYPTNICEKGYTNEKCDACDFEQNYYPDAKNDCVQCLKMGLQWFLFLTTVIATILFQLVFIQTTLATNRRYSTHDDEYLRRFKKGIYIRMTVSYSQVFDIILRLQKVGLHYFPLVIGWIGSPMSVIFYNSLCIFEPDANNLLYYEMSSIIIGPVVKLVVFSAIFILINRQHWKIQLGKVVCIFICLSYLELPGAVRRLVAFYTGCKESEDNKYFNSITGTECYTDAWYNYNGLVIPALVLWMGGFLIGAIAILYFNKAKFHVEHFVLYFGALYLGLKDDRYWWNIVSLVFRIALSILIIYLESNPNLLILWAFAAVYIYYSVFVKAKPYEIPDVYIVEKRLYRVYMVTLFSTAFNYFEQESTVVQVISLTVVICANIFAITLLCIKFWELRWKSLQFLNVKVVPTTIQSSQETVEEDMSEIEREIVRRGRATIMDNYRPPARSTIARATSAIELAKSQGIIEESKAHEEEEKSKN